MSPDREPLVVIVSGPSGSGKSTLVRKILDLPKTLLSISYTTRQPREAESKDHLPWYNFVNQSEFLRMINSGEFLEYAQVFGRNWYGTPRRWLREARERQKDLILEIDVQGAKQVRQQIPSSVSVFILPPSVDKLAERIRERGQDSEDEIAARLERARQELECFKDYEYAVVNDDLERAGRDVQAIVLAERCRVTRDPERITQVLKSLGG